MPQVFSPAEMQRRVAKLQEAMDQKGIGCALASSIHTSFYYSGFWYALPYGRLAATVIPRHGEPVLITPKQESRRAIEYSWLKDVRTYTDEEPALVGLVRLVKEVLGEKGLSNGRIGIEGDVISDRVLRALRTAFPKATFDDISDAMMRQRLVKSQEEIALIRQGADICKIAVRAGEDAIAEGKTELDVAMTIEVAAAREHAKRFPDLDFVCGQAHCKSGYRSVYGHTAPSGKKLTRGEIIQFGTPISIMGYFHTLARQRVIGPVPGELKKRYNVMLEAVNRCFEAMKPGVLCSEIDRTVVEVFKKAGYLEHKGFGTGHSFGLMGPFWGREDLGDLRLYNHTPLQEGMIESIEPSLYFPGLAGFITVDMVLVTKDGHEVLTEYPRELSSL
ncbi:MAG: aminopeptidase P family protein [Chloroflexi bacterium]|nr:aminopeptidase P family protein [Chloroflexota bacterium]